MTTALVWAAVGGLGGVGACARVLLDVEVNRRLRRPFPSGTIVVNLSGSFALGVIVGVGVAGDAYLLAGTALLGSYTTFSAWMLESERLAQLQWTPAVWANLAVGVLGGVGLAALGRVIGGAL